MRVKVIDVDVVKKVMAVVKYFGLQKHLEGAMKALDGSSDCCWPWASLPVDIEKVVVYFLGGVVEDSNFDLVE